MSARTNPARLVAAFRRAWSFCRRIDVSPRYFFVPGILSVIAAAFEAIGLGLLVPLVRGVIGGNYLQFRDLPAAGRVIEWSMRTFGERRSVAFAALLTLVFTSIVLKNAFRYQATCLSFEFVRRFSDRLRRKIYDRYLGFGKLYFDGTSTGHLYQTLIGMTDRIAIELKAVEQAFYSLVLIAAYFVVMAVISWPLTVFSVLIFPLIFFSMRWLTTRIRRSSNHYAELYLRLGARISNALACMNFIKAQCNEVREREWFSEASDEARRAEISIDRKQALNNPLQEVIMLGVILVVIGVMAYLSAGLSGSDVAGYMVFFVLLRRSSTCLTIFGTSVVSFAGITGPIREISRVFDDKGKYAIPDGDREFGGLRSAIEVRGLSFSYPDQPPVLANVHMAFRRGTTTALVGSSGGGKSTLINLLMRFYDVPAGSVWIDGTDLRELRLASWRSKIALVSQETHLFNASLRDNLTYGLEPRPDDERVLDALERARLGELVRRSPKGLDAEVGDRGVKLSGGEKQRVSIARAILKQAEIVILDEATSALDSITEKLVQEALNELIKDRTTIMVAHRLSTIEHADKIIVLEDGGVVEQGPRSELLALKGWFYRYSQKQGFV